MALFCHFRQYAKQNKDLDKNIVVGVIAFSSAFQFELDQQSTLIEQR
jgi:hypothetical protein